MRVYLAVAVIVALIAAVATQATGTQSASTSGIDQAALARMMGTMRGRQGSVSGGLPAASPFGGMGMGSPFGGMGMFLMGGADFSSIMEYQLCARLMPNPMFCMNYLS